MKSKKHPVQKWKTGKKRHEDGTEVTYKWLHQWSLCDPVHMIFRRLLQVWSADKVKTMFLHSDWRRVSGLCSIKHPGEEKGRKTLKYSVHKGICTNVSGLGAANDCSHEAAHWVETGIINKAKGKVYHSFWQVACMMGCSGAKCTPLLHICVLQFLVPMHFEVASKRKKKKYLCFTALKQRWNPFLVIADLRRLCLAETWILLWICKRKLNNRRDHMM